MRSGVSSELIIAEALIFFSNIFHTLNEVCARREKETGVVFGVRGGWKKTKWASRIRRAADNIISFNFSARARVMVFFLFN